MTFNVKVIVGMLLIVAGCSPETENNHLNNLSKLTCEATDLRNARFALADSMRRYQDSIQQPDNATSHKTLDWEKRLKKMSERKDMLATESRNLADSIRIKLSELTKEMSLEEKRAFNDKLKNIDCNGS